MSLPIRTTIDDIQAVCGYLATKPTGATLAEARAVVDRKHVDGRKLNALKIWGLIADEAGKLKITDRGRRSVMDSGVDQSVVLREVIGQVQPYMAVIERVSHRSEETISATDVAAHWHEHYRGEVSELEKTLNDQAVCFFQVAQGADLGRLVIGRKGMPTRFEFDVEATQAFINESTGSFQDPSTEADLGKENDTPTEDHDIEGQHADGHAVAIDGNRVFITHGKNIKILEQVKELVSYGKFEPVVAMEHETSAMPVPQKVMGGMRTCRAAVIHVSTEGVLYDEEGNEVPQINENVLIEIGAAMALYGEKFVLLVEEGVTLPSNLQGLYECRYQGGELNMPATMKLLKAFSEF